MDIRAPKGTDDILPPQSRIWSHAMAVFEDMSRRYGYGMVFTPMFERTELFERGVGADTDVVEKQMYTFADRKGRSLTLRPEATASVVRALLESGRAGVFKGAYSGPMFRYERPQKGRRRQFWQLGVEYLGEPSPLADVEVIEVGYRFLEKMAVPDIEVQLNSIGDPGDRVAYRTELQSWLREREEQLSPESRRRIDTNPLRVLDSKADRDITAHAPTPVDYLGTTAGEHFAAVKLGLENVGIPYVIAPRLVRGLDYYNRTVFEYVPRRYGAAQSTIGGGGRYDGLAETLGGKPMYGVGLALGLDRILLAGEDIDLGPQLDAYVVVADRTLQARAVSLVGKLRLDGFSVDMDLGDSSVTAQFRAADRRNADVAIVVGSEWAHGEVVIRDLTSGVQDNIRVEEIAPWLHKR